MAKQFLKECKETRDNFVKVAGTYNISNHLKLRTEIDSLLIMYDQLCERVRVADVDACKNTLPIHGVIISVCKAPSKVLPCSHFYSNRCLHPNHCNFKQTEL